MFRQRQGSGRDGSAAAHEFEMQKDLDSRLSRRFLQCLLPRTRRITRLSLTVRAKTMLDSTPEIIGLPQNARLFFTQYPTYK
jgi:hypothetical protein